MIKGGDQRRKGRGKTPTPSKKEGPDRFPRKRGRNTQSVDEKVKRGTSLEGM